MAARTDGSYHTLFGPCCAHNGIVYGKTNHNISLGFTRLTKSRLPFMRGYEQFMRGEQEHYIQSNHAFTSHLTQLYSTSLHDYHGMKEETELHYDDTHSKKALRIQAWKDLNDFNGLEDHLWYLPGKGTQYKMKIFEIAKPGKPPRMIGDLGVHASLQGFRITKFMKNIMADAPIAYAGGDIEFCPKPAPSALRRVFRNLIDPPGRFYFVYFSDDSCLALRTNSGKVLRFNVDISSCDASHTQSLFDLLVSITPLQHRSDMQVLVDQCKTQITVHDVVNKRNYVKFTPKSARLYSGSTITTLINNLANILIAHSIASSHIENAEDVIHAAARVGYIVTCEDCADWHQVQFLKHSPVLDDNDVIQPLLNIGVLLRLIGTCKGDLPGSKKLPLRTRAEVFQSALLNGAYPKARFRLLSNLQRQCSAAAASNVALYEKGSALVSKQLEYKVDDTEDTPVFSVSSSEVFARYGLTDLEIAEVEEEMGHCGYGDHYYSSGTEHILLADYGLSGREYE